MSCDKVLLKAESEGILLRYCLKTKDVMWQSAVESPLAGSEGILLKSEDIALKNIVHNLYLK